MLDRWLIILVINFVLRQLAKVSGTVDWANIKAEMDKAVRDFLPGTWFDDEGVAIADALLARVQAVLSNSDAIKHILELLAAQDYTGAFLALKDLLLGGWIPGGTKKGPNGYEYPATDEGKAAAACKAAA